MAIRNDGDGGVTLEKNAASASTTATTARAAENTGFDYQANYQRQRDLEEAEAANQAKVNQDANNRDRAFTQRVLSPVGTVSRTVSDFVEVNNVAASVVGAINGVDSNERQQVVDLRHSLEDNQVAMLKEARKSRENPGRELKTYGSVLGEAYDNVVNSGVDTVAGAAKGKTLEDGNGIDLHVAEANFDNAAKAVKEKGFYTPIDVSDKSFTDGFSENSDFLNRITTKQRTQKQLDSEAPDSSSIDSAPELARGLADAAVAQSVIQGATARMYQKMSNNRREAAKESDGLSF